MSTRSWWPVLALLGFLLAPGRVRAAEPVVSAAFSSPSIEQGEIVELVIRVLNPTGDPEPLHFELPPGFVGAGPSIGRSLSITNGQAATSLEFRYQLRSDEPGRFSIGPFRMRIGGKEYVTRALALTVRRAGQIPAVLLVTVTPKQPFVGQLTQVAVQLVQYAELSAGEEKGRPPMPGFWAERFSESRDYAARQGERRVAVSESRARVYPLSAGAATIGSAHLSVSVIASLRTPRGEWLVRTRVHAAQCSRAGRRARCRPGSRPVLVRGWDASNVRGGSTEVMPPRRRHCCCASTCAGSVTCRCSRRPFCRCRTSRCSQGR